MPEARYMVYHIRPSLTHQLTDWPRAILAAIANYNGITVPALTNMPIHESRKLQREFADDIAPRNFTYRETTGDKPHTFYLCDCDCVCAACDTYIKCCTADHADLLFALPQVTLAHYNAAKNDYYRLALNLTDEAVFTDWPFYKFQTFILATEVLDSGAFLPDSD